MFLSWRWISSKNRIQIAVPTAADKISSAGHHRIADEPGARHSLEGIVETSAGSGSLARGVGSQFAKTLSQAASTSWSHSSRWRRGQLPSFGIVIVRRGSLGLEAVQHIAAQRFRYLRLDTPHQSFTVREGDDLVTKGETGAAVFRGVQVDPKLVRAEPVAIDENLMGE